MVGWWNGLFSFLAGYNIMLFLALMINYEDKDFSTATDSYAGAQRCGPEG